MAQVFERALQLKEEGNLLFKEEKFNGALSKYDDAIQLHPGFKEAYLNAGVCCRRLRRYDLAIRYLIKAIANDRRYTKAYHQLAKVLQDVQDLPSAQKESLFFCSARKKLQGMIFPAGLRVARNCGFLPSILSLLKKVA